MEYFLLRIDPVVINFFLPCFLFFLKSSLKYDGSDEVDLSVLYFWDNPSS